MDGSHPAAWTLDEARIRFDELIARARTGEAQHITLADGDELTIARRAVDQPAAPAKTLYDVFKPLIGSGVVFERLGGEMRPFPDE